MAVLIAAATVVIGLVSVLALRSFLIERVDAQLTATQNRATAAVNGRPNHVPGLDNHGPAEGALLAPGQSAGTLVALVSSDSTVTAGLLSPQGVVTTVSSSQTSALVALAPGGHPTTIDLGAAGDYRVAAVSSSNGQTLVIGLPLAEVKAATTQLLVVILSIGALGILVAVAAGRFVIRRELRPLERVAETATRVADLPLEKGQVDLLERVAVADTDPRTEVGRVGAALNNMLAHIGRALSSRQASEDKVRRFVADASHELRTPLASIRGYAELTRRGGAEVPQDVRHALDRIESEAVRMTGLVEDLLLLARLDEGRELDRRSVDLSRMIVDAVSDAHAAGPAHVWNIDLPEEPVEIVGDEARLHQVVVNLLANARVHTPAGSQVTVSLIPEPSQVTVSVVDDGPGIPEAELPALFERFARGDSSRTRATGSTGLGLAIVNAVVSAHGGTVSVTSEPGRTEFRVVLPLVKENDPGADPVAS
jgi:two-component system OmpR family sensor kinase